MQRLLWAGLLAVPALALTPSRSDAFGIHPDCAHGFGWLQAKALNKFAWIHMHGPLYNHGPSGYYGGPGYAYRPYPPIAAHHGYIPAYASAAYGHGGHGYGYGGYPAGHTAPPAQAAPAAEPIHSPKQPPTPAVLPSGWHQGYGHGYQPAAYQSMYPSYFAPAWPGVQR